MKHRLVGTVGSVALVATLALTGCTNDAPAATGAASSTRPIATAPTATPSPSSSVSEIDASVQTFVKALDGLGIKHTAPVRSDVGLSGAKARFDIAVDGYDAGINVFPDAATLTTWGKASDSFGGIYVASGNAVLSLNSSEGVSDSANIAPKIASAIGGEAHGV